MEITTNGFPRTTNDSRILDFGTKPDLIYMGMTYDQWCERYGADALPVYELGNSEPVGFATIELLELDRKDRRNTAIINFVLGMISGACWLSIAQTLGWV